MSRSGNYHTNYGQEISIFRTPGQKAWLALLVAGLVAFPFLAGNYYIYVVNFALISVIGALGLNLLTGFTGQISLGQAAFLAVGAYATALLSSHFHWPFLVTIFLAALVTMVIGLVIGAPSLRLEGLYLAIATMALYFIVAYIISHWNSLTGGPYGIKVPPLQIMGLKFDNNFKLYFLLLSFVAGSVYFVANLARSRTGRAFVAIRDRDIAAEAMGIDVARYKILAFAVSSFLAGIAGGLYAYLVGVIAPDHFTFEVSIQYIAMIIAGGLGSIEGAILGAFFISLLPEVLRFVTGSLAESFPVFSGNFLLLREAAYGLVIVVFLLLEPAGLYGIWRNLRNSWETFPYKYR